MSRYLAMLGVAFVVQGAVGGPDVAPPPRPVVFFPLTTGSRWVYQTPIGERVEVVTDVVVESNVTHVTVERVGGGGRRFDSQVVAVSQSGLTAIESLGTQLTPHQRLLSVPAKSGDSWETMAGLPQLPDELKETRTAYLEDTVVVPAGRYRTIRVEAERKLDGLSSKNVYWYAPSVGLVKKLEGGTVTVLKSFTSGKE